MIEIRICSDPKIQGGEPLVWAGGSLPRRVVDVFDLLDAGDSPKDVAQNFGLAQPHVELLSQVRENSRAPRAEK